MADWLTTFRGPSADDFARSDKGIRTARTLERIGVGVSGAGLGLLVAGIVWPETLSFVLTDEVILGECVVLGGSALLFLSAGLIRWWNTGAAHKR